MSLLEHPTAQALLGDAEVSAADVRAAAAAVWNGSCGAYLPRFYREERRELAQVILQGKLSNLQRKTSEPIAYLANRERKPVQHFVGAGAWDDESVMAELRRHVAETRADPNAVLVVDGSGFARRATPPAAWPGSGAGGWARSRTARWACSWPTSRPRATPRWIGSVPARHVGRRLGTPGGDARPLKR